MLHADIEKHQSPIEGIGLVARKDLAKGAVLWRSRPADCRELTKEELRDVPNRHLVYQQGDKFILTLDGSEYTNHSCDPNAVWLGDEMMIADRDIRQGEEITYDYATTETSAGWWARWTCGCGSPNCRGIITGLDALDPKLQRRHQGHLPSWALDFIEKHKGIRRILLLGFRRLRQPLYWLLLRIKTHPS